MERKEPETRKVVLPGGHEIEMSPHAHMPRERGQLPLERSFIVREDLHVCPECSGGLVHPTDWEPAGRNRWKVDLRCPECEWRGGGVHDQKTMDRFDEALDQGTEELLDDLNHLSRAILEEEAERFIDALERDLIVPEDF